MKVTIKKGVVSKFVLEKLSQTSELVLDALFPQNMVGGKVYRDVLGLPTGHNISKENFSITLSRLCKHGFVERKGCKRFSSWVLTKKGKEKLESYQFIINPTKPDGIPRLVMYDIPETERKKRDLLRYELVACDYKQLQKSVWIGYCPLPEEFIKSLKYMKLKYKVQILSIHKTGTLNEF
jgi:DNA-binding transcriptional regulator PaaX